MKPKIEWDTVWFATATAVGYAHRGIDGVISALVTGLFLAGLMWCYRSAFAWIASRWRIVRLP